MINWLKRMLASFRAWSAANEEKHKHSPVQACCSKPPQNSLDLSHRND